MEALILFPHQLFRGNDSLARGRRVYLVEDALYFRQFAFHKQKLVLHRASMQAHAATLRGEGHDVRYLESRVVPDMNALARELADGGIVLAHFIDPVDDWLERFLLSALGDQGIKAQKHPTPMFLSPEETLRQHFRGRERWAMSGFYIAQRRRLGLLVERGQPVGGRWSFDTSNRKRLPPRLEIPAPWTPGPNRHVDEAIAYVEREFAGNPGTLTHFRYPVTHGDARRWLEDFVATRLRNFGDYEDAIAADQNVLFHSVLSPMLNVGLLEPAEVLDAAIGAQGIPLNSLEGFVRQIIGWREYMRAAYVLRGRRQRTANYWNHTEPLPRSFWTASTGLLPVDSVVKRVLDNAYAHHIERLMVLANFMQICGFRPDDVYRWFMELFIDAYDWVMVPNVYGMALFADGGLMTTKPYISSSNYLRKMSDFPSGAWCGAWDGLFWTFIGRNRQRIEINPRMRMLTQILARMGDAKRRDHDHAARQALERLRA